MARSTSSLQILFLTDFCRRWNLPRAHPRYVEQVVDEPSHAADLAVDDFCRSVSLLSPCEARSRRQRPIADSGRAGCAARERASLGTGPCRGPPPEDRRNASRSSRSGRSRSVMSDVPGRCTRDCLLDVAIRQDAHQKLRRPQWTRRSMAVSVPHHGSGGPAADPPSTKRGARSRTGRPTSPSSTLDSLVAAGVNLVTRSCGPRRRRAIARPGSWCWRSPSSRRAPAPSSSRRWSMHLLLGGLRFLVGGLQLLVRGAPAPRRQIELLVRRRDVLHGRLQVRAGGPQPSSSPVDDWRPSAAVATRPPLRRRAPLQSPFLPASTVKRPASLGSPGTGLDRQAEEDAG